MPTTLDKFMQDKIRKALAAAGIIVPEDADLRAKFSAELSRRGIALEPNLTLIANGNYVLVVPD